MTRRFDPRRAVALLVATGAAVSISGCGKTLVFAERDGVNLAIRADASSSPPLEVNFGLNRTIATIVPPAGEKNGKPDGDAVSMFAGFQIDNTLAPTKPLDADLEISTQFASGKAATAVAGDPQLVAQIVKPRSATFSTSASSMQLRAWLKPPDSKYSENRAKALQAWLRKRYPPKGVPVVLFLNDESGAEYEPDRKAALQDDALMKTNP